MRPASVQPGKEQPTIETRTDEALFVEIQRGDQAAFATLVRRYEAELYCYLARYTGDAALAEDVFQNTFLQVFQKRQSFDAQRRVRPWLYAVATHQAIDALRRQMRNNRNILDVPAANDPESGIVAPCDALPAPGPGVDALAINAEARQQVRATVDELPEHLKPVVIMSYFQSMPHKDIAEALAIPVGTVKSRLFAAVKLLQEKWNSTPMATSRS